MFQQPQPTRPICESSFSSQARQLGHQSRGPWPQNRRNCHFNLGTRFLQGYICLHGYMRQPHTSAPPQGVRAHQKDADEEPTRRTLYDAPVPKFGGPGNHQIPRFLGEYSNTEVRKEKLMAGIWFRPNLSLKFNDFFGRRLWRA